MASNFKMKTSHVHIFPTCCLKSKQHRRSASIWWQRWEVAYKEMCVYFCGSKCMVWLWVVFANSVEASCTWYHNYAVVWVQRREITVRDNHLETTAEMTVPCNPRVRADVIWPSTCPQMIWRHLQVWLSAHLFNLFSGISVKLRRRRRSWVKEDLRETNSLTSL